ncbi:MAG: PD40 domain-containing protein [Bacteroidales bacterium]|nr:PD40 domain-containing protein [Bacteroidales bacterium]
MKNNVFSFVVILIMLADIVFITSKASAQDDFNIGMAETMVNNEDFSSAITLYKKMVEMEPDNGMYHFQLGFCFLNTAAKKDSSIYEFKKAYNAYKPKQRKGTQGYETEFFLGRAYRVNDSIDQALSTLEKLKRRVSNKKVIEIIDKEIDQCNLAKEMKSHPVEIQVQNLGAIVNSLYTDHSPVLTADESMLFFTSRRPYKDHEIMADDQCDENIYVSHKLPSGTWSAPEPLNDMINTGEHEATASLSYDGTELFLYRDDDNGTLLMSHFENDDWTAPVKLNENINTKYRETGACLSTDGQRLYFASDRPGGYGGLDIYVSLRQSDGSWGPAKNVGDAVNTSDDEEGPFILPDNSKLYFSSKGHRGMGGYDIFYCDATDFGTWSRAVNAGYPINTSEDDVFLFITPTSERSYFASERRDGIGRSDIYVMGLPSVMETELTVVTGLVGVCEGKIPESLITIRDNSLGITSTAIPNIHTGKFIFIGRRVHNYTVTATVDGKTVYSETFDIESDAPAQMSYKTIQLDPEHDCPEPRVPDEEPEHIPGKYYDENGVMYDHLAEIEDIVFPFGDAKVLGQTPSLDSLVKYLKNNRDAVVEIRAYCDAKGSAVYNLNLSKKRGQAVYNYLIQRGVQTKQLSVLACGEENPISFNIINGEFDDESKAYNRRVEFLMKQQGSKETLLIRPITTVPDKYRNPLYIKEYEKADGTPESEI